MEAVDCKKTSEFFKALSHPTRLMIIEELMKSGKCVNDIRELVRVRQSNISQHLCLLKLNGIVDYKQKGKMRCYFLKETKFLKNLFRFLEKSNVVWQRKEEG